MSERKFSEEELQSLLKRAVKNQHEKDSQYSEQDLIDAAEKMGVGEDAVREELNRMESEQNAKQAIRSHSKRINGFLIHLAIFVAVNGVFFFSGFRMFGPPMMKMFPFFPWIIFLVFHGLSAFGVKGRGCCRR